MKYFIVSLCKNGILGGGIVADLEKITYKTGKVTVPQKYRNLEMNYKDIVSIKKGWLFIFPTVTLKMNDSEEYKFIVFSRKRFIKLLENRTCVRVGDMVQLFQQQAMAGYQAIGVQLSFGQWVVNLYSTQNGGDAYET